MLSAETIQNVEKRRTRTSIIRSLVQRAVNIRNRNLLTEAISPDLYETSFQRDNREMALANLAFENRKRGLVQN